MNLNDRVHNLAERRGPTTTKRMAGVSSYDQYSNKSLDIGNDRYHNCIYMVDDKEKILSNFKDRCAYEKYASTTLVDIVKNKVKYKDF